jgi:hypothetical protein
MRTVTSIGCAALLVGLAPIAGAANEVSLSSTNDKACEFTGSLVGDVGTLANVVYDVGQLGFSCNYTGTVNIGMTTDDGTILEVEGEPDSGVLYQIRWLVPPTGNPNLLWNSALGVATFGPWVRNTGASPNAIVSALVQVRLLDPLTVAGNYTDTVTFTVAPN